MCRCSDYVIFQYPGILVFMVITHDEGEFVKITQGDSILAFNPISKESKLSGPKFGADIVLISTADKDFNGVDQVTYGDDKPFVVQGPGEYEIKGVEIVGIPSFHDDKKGEERGLNNMYNFKIDSVNIAHLGDLGQGELSPKQIEDLGNVDVLMIPVGGVYTIDASSASKIAAQLEPSVIIPMHYLDKDSKVNLEPVEKFLKEMGKDNVESDDNLTISREKLPSEPKAVILNIG